jgi:hypothetical protein
MKTDPSMLMLMLMLMSIPAKPFSLAGKGIGLILAGWALSRKKTDCLMRMEA